MPAATEPTMGFGSATNSAAAPPTTLSTLVGLALAFGWPVSLYIPGLSTHKVTNVHDIVVNVWVKWLVTVVLGVIAFRIQRRAPVEFGLRGLGWRDGLAALGGLVVAFLASGIASHMVALTSNATDLQKLAAVPVGWRVALVLTAAICEEFMYRGFGIEELTFLIGSRWMAAVLSLVLFTVSHVSLYGLSAALVIPGAVGAVLTGLYLWRRNLPSCILMHAIIDGIFVVLVPSLMKAH